MSYYLNSTTNATTLIFTILIALSIFFIIAKLLNSTAELIRVKRSEKEMSEYIDIQRRGYERVVHKMESTRHSDEHGIGLRSVKRIVEKYNGFMRCVLENGEFVFRAALFHDNSPSKHKNSRLGGIPKRGASSLFGLCLGAIVMLNVSPAAAKAASEVLSINIPTIRSFYLGWGDNSISIESPEFSGNGANDLNSAVKKYTDEAKEKFLWYFNRKYNGYVAEEMTYLVIRDDEKYFIAQFNVTINAGGSMDYSCWIIYDKSAGKVLELSDLFKEGSDYIGVISAEILKEMKDQNDKYNYGYFVDGADAFTEISEDANSDPRLKTDILCLLSAGERYYLYPGTIFL